MAFRKVQRRIRDEGGNVIGGTLFEVRVYSNFGAGTLASLKLDLAGADARDNPGYPNSGWTAKLTTQLLGTDATAIVDSTAGIQKGDRFPIIDGTFFHYLTVKAVPDATHITLEATTNADGSPSGAHTYPVGAVLNGPQMFGHWQGYVSDVQDYDLTVKNLTTGIEGSPDQLFTTQAATVLSFQEEGVSTGIARGVLNAIGAGISLTDDVPNTRVNLTHVDNQTYITTAAESTLTNERVLGTTVILRGTIASRPAAGTAGYLYASSDETPKSLYRDNGASWDQVSTVGGATDRQLFTATGTWTKPGGAKTVIVICIGGGGGGAGCTTANPGGAGGGGAYAIGVFDATAFGATEGVAVGAGGTAGAAGANNGGAGGESNFGSTPVIRAFGGGGGSNPNSAYSSGGGGGGRTAAGSVGGTGIGGAGGGPSVYSKVATPGDVTHLEGAQGGSRNTGSGALIPVRNAWDGGGGGGGDSSLANENPGGSSMLGAGGGGGGAAGANAAGSGGANNSFVASGGGTGGTGSGGNGTAGTSRSGTGRAGDGGGGGGSGATGGIGGAGGVPGGGGGGAGKGTTTTVAGGAGARGEVIVYTLS